MLRILITACPLICSLQPTPSIPAWAIQFLIICLLMYSKVRVHKAGYPKTTRRHDQ